MPSHQRVQIRENAGVDTVMSRNGYRTVMCARTPAAAAASNWLRQPPTIGSAAGTLTISAVSPSR